jgi:hypothetical protein
MTAKRPPPQLGRLHAERKARDAALLAALKRDAAELEALFANASSHWGYEDPVYRFYYQSFKVYGLQDETLAIVAALEKLMPDRPLTAWFREIVEEGTGKSFTLEHNQRWTTETRPIVEAFFHARYFLEMACRYARELDEAPDVLPSGWAALLCLFDSR